jgi:cytochrome c oxidase assembly protein subunit 11
MRQAPSSEISRRNRRLVAKLLVLTGAMFGFGFALVPLYDVFCQVTGLNAKTGRLDAAAADVLQVDATRTVTVEFVTSTDRRLPWDFRAKQPKVSVHPGAVTEVMFTARNTAPFAVTGQAVPSVLPGTAARYLNKTECFCFRNQTLQAQETRDMPVRFVVDAKLPPHVTTLTLSYTFFELPRASAAAG